MMGVIKKNNSGSENSGSNGKALPVPGSEAEKKMFDKIQKNFAEQFDKAFPDKLAPKTVIIIPSLTLDQEILSKISGINYYEERLLCMLMLLRMPRTHVVYLTSMPVDPVIIDYYLHLLPGITGHHAQHRLHLLSCYDNSPRSLTEKILERPRLIERIKSAIPANHIAHMACFNVTDKERTLAVNLGLPIYGCDPDLFELGNKSNSRKVFKECGLNPPAGIEDLYTEKDIINALTKMKKDNPSLRKAVIKINEGFSGDGNAIFSYQGIKEKDDIGFKVNSYFYARFKPVASNLSTEEFLLKFREMGGIVEEFVEGDIKISPSVQCRINPKGKCVIISTHDQELGGESGQVFIGAHFPANIEYASELGSMGMKITKALRDKGVLGRFGIDFISVKEKKGWKHYPIEINLRKGGTTHPYIMLQFLTDGDYNAEKGLYFTANGQSRYYFCSDNLRSEKFHGFTPHDLIDIAMLHGLHYDGTFQEGVMFHLIGALSQFGKLGVVCIGSTPERALKFYKKTVELLKMEAVHQNYVH
jgi:hypothetical protein